MGPDSIWINIINRHPKCNLSTQALKSWNTIFAVEELEAQERQEASSEATAKAWGGAEADLWNDLCCN